MGCINCIQSLAWLACKKFVVRGTFSCDTATKFSWHFFFYLNRSIEKEEIKIAAYFQYLFLFKNLNFVSLCNGKVGELKKYISKEFGKIGASILDDSEHGLLEPLLCSLYLLTQFCQCGYARGTSGMHAVCGQFVYDKSRSSRNIIRQDRRPVIYKCKYYNFCLLYTSPSPRD